MLNLAAEGDTTRSVLTALTALGAMLSVGGLLWGAAALRREYRRLDWQLRGVNIILRSELADDEKQRLKEQVLQPSGSWNDILYIQEVIRHHVIRQAYENLGLPLVFTLLGVVVSTVAGVWSLWA